VSSHHLVDKGLALEARASGWGDAKAFPEPNAPARYAPDRPVLLTRIELRLRVDPQVERLFSEATLHLTAVGPRLGDVALDLAEERSVLSVETAEGAPIAHRHIGGRLTLLDRPESSLVVVIRSEGTPVRGLYFTGPTEAAPDRPHMAWSQCQDEDAHHLFPCLDQPGHKQPIHAHITVPAGMTVVGNGALLRQGPASTEDGAGAVGWDPSGWETWTWAEDRPIPVYLFTVVVGPLEVVDGGTAGLGATPLRYLAPKGADPAVMAKVFARTGAMIETFEAAYGAPYPWPRYDQVIVHDFIFGGMENAGATTLTDLCLTDPSSELVHDPDDLIAHELAHQWFGDLVTCREWSQGWLNEGWATWSESIWRRARFGDAEAQLSLLDMLDHYLDEAGSRYMRPIVDRRWRAPIDLFDRHLYEKGALVLQTLCHELGPAPFWAGVRAYLQLHAYTAVHTRDLQVALERSSGRDLSRFFEAFVLGAGHPTLVLRAEHQDGVLHIHLKQTQQGPNVVEVFPITVPIEVTDAEGQLRLHRLSMTDREARLSLPLAAPPLRVEIDPRLEVLADVELAQEPPALIASLRQGSTVITRIRAARALSKKQGPRSRDALHAALAADPHWAVRAELAALLSASPSQQAVAPLIAALTDSDARVRAKVAEALGRAPSSASSLHALRAIIDGEEPSVHVRGAALRAYGQLRPQDAVSRLSDALKHEAWGDLLRVRAAEGLGASRSADALPLLLSLLSPAHSARAQAAAASALGKLATDLPALKAVVVERIEETAINASFRVRLAAIGALGAVGAPRSGGVLRDIHAEDLDGRTRRVAYEALERLRAAAGDQGPIAALRAELEAVRDQNGRLRDRLDALERKSESDLPA
jgi:aminopeptidase N